MGFVFPVILAMMACIVLFRRHGGYTWWTLVRQNRYAAVSAVLPTIVFSQVWLAFDNYCRFGQWLVNPNFFRLNNDGLQGSVANLCRYLTESIHLTRPVDLIFKHATHISIVSSIEKIFRFLMDSVFDSLGAAVPFTVQWAPHESYSWFGPFGFMLILPAIIISAIRGPRRLKAVALAILSYLYALCFIASWTPKNVAYFTVFFACGGFFASFLLPPWRFTRTGRTRLQVACALLLFYICLFNVTKPVISFPSGFASLIEYDLKTAVKIIYRNNIWTRTNWGMDRNVPAEEIFGDKRVEQCARGIPAGSSVGIIYDDLSKLYPFMMALHHAEPTSIRLANTDGSFSKNFKYLIYIDAAPSDTPDKMIEHFSWIAYSGGSLFNGAFYYRP